VELEDANKYESLIMWHFTSICVDKCNPPQEVMPGGQLGHWVALGDGSGNAAAVYVTDELLREIHDYHETNPNITMELSQVQIPHVVAFNVCARSVEVCDLAWRPRSSHAKNFVLVVASSDGFIRSCFLECSTDGKVRIDRKRTHVQKMVPPLQDGEVRSIAFGLAKSRRPILICAVNCYQNEWGIKGYSLKTNEKDATSKLAALETDRFVVNAVVPWENDTVVTIGKHSQLITGVSATPRGDCLVSVSIDGTLAIYKQNSDYPIFDGQEQLASLESMATGKDATRSRRTSDDSIDSNIQVEPAGDTDESIQDSVMPVTEGSY